MIRKAFACWVLVGWMGLGCSAPVNPLLQTLPRQYIVGSMEGEPMEIEKVVVQEAFQDPDHEEQVTVMGMIGGSMDCFDPSMAAFLMMDLPADGHATAPGHDPDACAFCKRRRADAPAALVQFMDAKGQPYPLSAQKIFDLKKGQKVIVQGKGRYDQENKTLLISASRLQLPAD